jgi:hypothetical protein
MKIETSKLTGAAIDWAVARCEGIINGDVLDVGFILEGGYSPSTNWAQGGPIIERENINIETWHGAWQAELEFLPDDDTHYRYGKGAGPTPLIAVMRCYCASKLGHEVDVPDELC